MTIAANALAAAPKIDRRKLSAPGLKAFFRIAEKWKLSREEEMVLLGQTSRATVHNWRTNPDVALSKDTLERISYVLGIWKALQMLLPNEAAADGWIRRPNMAAPFGGRSALARMLSGQVADLYLVRQYLDAERGG